MSRASLRMAVRQAEAAGLRVEMNDHPALLSPRAVYFPAGHDSRPTPLVLVSSRLDPASQVQTLAAMVDAHRAHVPIEALVRATLAGRSAGQVAAQLGVARAAVEHRVRHLAPDERRMVRIDLADAG